jgi:DNA invertase Pin-like site-specific DNA recombinase
MVKQSKRSKSPKLGGQDRWPSDYGVRDRERDPSQDRAATIMAGLAEFERDLIRDRVKSGLAAARGRGVELGRQVGQRPSDKKAKRVLGCVQTGCPIGSSPAISA